jgi:hypothetical protein
VTRSASSGKTTYKGDVVLVPRSMPIAVLEFVVLVIMVLIDTSSVVVTEYE